MFGVSRLLEGEQDKNRVELVISILPSGQILEALQCVFIAQIKNRRGGG